MKNIIHSLIICLILLSCKTENTGFTNKYNKQIKESYLYDFKINYFKKLLIQGFDKSEAIISVVSSDRSGYGESILTMEDYKFLDSLVEVDKKIIMQDSLSRIGRVGEGAQGKHVFAYALHKFQSKWLNKIANSRFKESRKTIQGYTDN
jgi:hypothetical protein